MKRILFENIGGLVLLAANGERQLAGAEMANWPVLGDAFLLVEGGRIVDFGAMSACPTFAVDERVDASGRFLLPAFCDSHTHLVFAATRETEFVDKIRGVSYAEIAAKGGGIINSALRLRAMDEGALFEQALARLEQAMAQGTGAIEIKSGYGLDMASELKMLRVIRRLKEQNLIPVKSTFLAAHAVPPEFAGNKDGYLQHVINDMLPRVAGENLADYCDIFCEKGFFSPEDTDLLLTAAARYGLGAKIHANQLDFSGGVQVGVKHKARSVDHLEHAGEAEIAALLESQILESQILDSPTMPTALPMAAFFLRLPYPPARKMIDSGLPVAIATDFNPGSSPSSRMSFAISLACIQMRMLPEEAIAAATINGAQAMDLSHEVGSIAKGKKAQLILTRKMENLAFLPYNFGQDSIERVFFA